MIHKTCPICGEKISELRPNKGDRNVNHKVYICDADVDHKFWVSEYESDSLRWNPGATHEDTLYFRKFQYTNREVVRDMELKKLTDMVNSKEYIEKMAGCDDDTEYFGRRDILKKYENSPDYEEVFDAKVHENLLGIIQSQNETIRGLVEEYGKLEKYTDELQLKYDASLTQKNTTASGIILKA